MRDGTGLLDDTAFDTLAVAFQLLGLFGERAVYLAVLGAPLTIPSIVSTASAQWSEAAPLTVFAALLVIALAALAIPESDPYGSTCARTRERSARYTGTPDERRGSYL